MKVAKVEIGLEINRCEEFSIRRYPILSSTLVAAIVAALGSVLSALVAASVALWLARKINVVSTGVDTVHHLVDGTKTTLENRIAQLEDIITTSNKEIPPTTR